MGELGFRFLAARASKVLGLLHQFFVAGDVDGHAAFLGHDAGEIDGEAVGVVEFESRFSTHDWLEAIFLNYFRKSPITVDPLNAAGAVLKNYVDLRFIIHASRLVRTNIYS